MSPRKGGVYSRGREECTQRGGGREECTQVGREECTGEREEYTQGLRTSAWPVVLDRSP